MPPPIVATYIRASKDELDRLRADPRLATGVDVRAAYADGRAIDVGRRWEELGCLLDGGITTPTSGPVVGDVTLACPDERQAWSFVEPDRVALIVRELGAMTRNAFKSLYQVDEDDTADKLPEDQTGSWGDTAEYLYQRFLKLRSHYRTAAERGEGMLVRIGERLDEPPPVARVIMRPRVLLFDIDGTLIDSDGAGRRAIEGAFERRYGRRDACARISFGGMTDRAILRAGLAAIEERSDESAIDALLVDYLEILRHESTRGEQARVLAGVEAALDAVVRHDVAVGLGTGNVREGARLKLTRHGLYERFAFGGFGCDSEDRAELLRMGAVRGADHLGVALAQCRVVVIGDTPKDVAAASAIGAEAFAVASGSYDIGALRAAGARYAFESLAASGAIDVLLGSA